MQPAWEATDDRLQPFTASEYQCDARTTADHRALERLSLSENPYGPSGLATAAAAAELGSLNRYPDASCAQLTDALARHYGLPRDAVLVGNGVDELLLAIAHTFAEPGEPALCHERTYYGHFSSLALTAAVVSELPLDASGLALDPLLDAVPTAALAYVCNPHNPTATALPPAAIDELAEAAERAGCILVLDEAYAEFADGAHWGSGLPHLGRGNVIVLRSFSKAYALAGLRCGYALADPELIRRLARVRHPTPFGVNRVALAAARAALGDQAHLRTCVRRTHAVRDSLRLRLIDAGHPVLRSETNFLFVETPRPAEAVCAELRDRHLVHARPCGALGFPHHLRLGVPDEHERDRVLEALLEALGTSRRAAA